MPPETARLVYFVQEDKNIFLCIKTDAEWFWRIPISPEKGLDLIAGLAPMVQFALRK